jgi:quinolinate synthase
MTTQTSTAPSVNDLIVAAPSESCDTELAEGPWVFDLVPGYGPASCRSSTRR